MKRVEELDQIEDAMDVKQVAKLLGYTKKYIYELIHKHLIKGWFMVNKSYRFRRKELKAWIDAGMHLDFNRRRCRRRKRDEERPPDDLPPDD